MNKIVREHYPVERLPEDLREHFPGAETVTVELTTDNDKMDDDDADVAQPLSANEAVALMRQMQKENAARGINVTTEEAVRRIRELRDEWDD